MKPALKVVASNVDENGNRAFLTREFIEEARAKALAEMPQYLAGPTYGSTSEEAIGKIIAELKHKEYQIQFVNNMKLTVDPETGWTNLFVVYEKTGVDPHTKKPTYVRHGRVQIHVTKTIKVIEKDKGAGRTEERWKAVVHH